MKDKPETTSTFEESSLTKLTKLFDLRHELVHDPVRRSFFNTDIYDWMYCSAHIVSGTDIVLTQAIASNLVPRLERKVPEQEGF